MCGNPNLDFEALERNSKYEGGFSVATAAVQWLWQVSDEGQARVMWCAGLGWAVSSGCTQGRSNSPRCPVGLQRQAARCISTALLDASAANAMLHTCTPADAA